MPLPQLGNAYPMLCTMNATVAVETQCDQVLLAVVSGMAAEFPVVNLEVRHRAARLASPAIAA